MLFKNQYANFTVYESDKDCKTSDSISISVSDGKTLSMPLYMG